MRKCLLMVAFALVGALPCFLLAADDIVGARWAVEAKGSKKGEWVQESVFRATGDGKVFFGPKQIGTYKQKGNDINMEVTGRDKQNGTYTMTKLKTDGSIYVGTFKHKDGKEQAIRIRLLAD